MTPTQVKEVAEKYLSASNRTVGFFLPTAKPERTPVPEVPDIAKLVEGYKGREVKSVAGETLDVSPMAIEARVQRPEPIGGIKVALLPKKTRGDSVHLRLTLHYGNAENLKGFSEAAGFLPDLMIRGTKSMTRQQIKDALDKNFARLRTGMGGRMTGLGVGGITFSIETRRTNLPAVMEILRQILREPTLPASEFDVMKNEEIAGIEQGRSDPMRQGMTHFQRVFYRRYPHDDVRYVPTIEEEIERTRKVSIDQVRTLYHGYLGANHGELVVIGALEPSEILPILEKTFEGWKAEKPYARIERPVQLDLVPERETVQTADKANAIYLAGLQLPIKDSDPDYPALVSGNYILGGGALSSRIADRLRQKGGLSYGAQSLFSADPLEAHAALMIFAIYNPINVEKVVTGVDEEVNRLLRDGVMPEELEKAKKGYVQQLQVQRTNDMMLASMISENLFVGRTMQFQADLESKIKELTPELVNTAMRKHIDPKRLSIITAGDFKNKGVASGKSREKPPALATGR